MTISRAIPAAVLAVLLGTALTACGDDSENDDAAEATTHACRSFVLIGGADANQLAEELQAVISGTGGYNEEDVTERVLAIRAAATKAGLTEDLPKKDFRLFATLVDATLRAETAVAADADSGSGVAPALGAYVRAVKAVDARCR